MEILKEVKVFETYEHADEELKKYAEANDKTYGELIKRINANTTEHPEGEGNGLELICAVELMAVTGNQQRAYDFETGNDLIQRTSLSEYKSIPELADALKGLAQISAYCGVKVTPLFYTVNIHLPLHLPSDEEISAMRKEIYEETKKADSAEDRQAGECFSWAVSAFKNADFKESVLTETEREEFRKYFFTE